MKQDVEHKIIDAARILFYEKGYMGVTVRDIAKEADVNLALLHYYFRTKDNIFKIVFDEAFTLLFTKLNKALLSEKSLFEKIELMIDSYVSVGLKYPQLPSFVMNELSVNAEVILAMINNHKDKSALNKNFECFSLEIQDAISNKIIKDVDPKSILTDIQSLSLYPFVARKILLYLVLLDEKAYNKMLKNRVKHIADTIINNIKL